MSTASGSYCLPMVEFGCGNWGKESYEGQACGKLSMKRTASQLAERLFI
jgi:hypothetical protein